MYLAGVSFFGKPCGIRYSDPDRCIFCFGFFRVSLSGAETGFDEPAGYDGDAEEDPV